MSNENKELTTIQPAGLEALGSFDSLLDQMNESEQDLQNFHDDIPDGDIQYVKFLKYGQQEVTPWVYGQDGKEIPPESVWKVDPTTFKRGFSGFKTQFETGRPQKGEKPDKVYSTWLEKLPERPESMPWVRQPTYQFRALCVESPDEQDLGAYVEVEDWRKMSDGYKEIEKSLRARAREIDRLMKSGAKEEAALLATNFYPLVKFNFKIGVKTTYGPTNKGIVELVGWGTKDTVIDGPVQSDAGEPEGDLGEELGEAPQPRRRGRSRN